MVTLHRTPGRNSFGALKQHAPWLVAFVLARLSNKVACRKLSVLFPKLWPGTRTTFPAQSVPSKTLKLPSKVTLGEPAAERAPYAISHLGGLAMMQQAGREQAKGRNRPEQGMA